MKLLLIQPAVADGIFGSVTKSHRSASTAFQSLPIVAALTPEDFEVEIIDMRVPRDKYAEGIEFESASQFLNQLGDRISKEEEADLVGFSVLTAQVPLVYRMATNFRARGIPVALGGYHASLVPDEATQQADAVVIGEAELAWPELIDDFRQGKLRSTYKADRLCDLDAESPRPRRDLLDADRYSVFNVVQATRGCPYGCEFCSVSSFFGSSYRKRDPEKVAEELRDLLARRDGEASSLSGRIRDGAHALAGRYDVFFADDNLIFDRQYAKELFDTIKHLGFKWSCQVSLSMAYDEELLQKAGASGCSWALIGFESFSPGSLDNFKKNRGLAQDGELKNLDDMAGAFAKAVSNFHRHGINVLGHFILGIDGDSAETMARTIEASTCIGLDAAMFYISTPFPGTALYARLRDDGRLISDDWADYTQLQAVFAPEGTTTDELYDGVRSAYSRFYRWPKMISRALRSPRNFTNRAALNYTNWRKSRRIMRGSGNGEGG